MENSATIIIAEDKKLFRDIIVRELEPHNIITISEAGNGEELLSQLRHLEPDVVLLDLEMPVMDGNKAMQVICSNFPAVKVIILSTHAESTLIDHFMCMGARGYLPKDAIAGNIQMLADAVHNVKNGGNYVIYPGEKRRNLPGAADSSESKDNRSNEEIALEMGIKLRKPGETDMQGSGKNSYKYAEGFFRYVFGRGLIS